MPLRRDPYQQLPEVGHQLRDFGGTVDSEVVCEAPRVSSRVPLEVSPAEELCTVRSRYNCSRHSRTSGGSPVRGCRATSRAGSSPVTSAAGRAGFPPWGQGGPHLLRQAAAAADAGVPQLGYEQLRAAYEEAAALLGHEPGALEHAVWRFRAGLGACWDSSRSGAARSPPGRRRPGVV